MFTWKNPTMKEKCKLKSEKSTLAKNRENNIFRRFMSQVERYIASNNYCLELSHVMLLLSFYEQIFVSFFLVNNSSTCIKGINKLNNIAILIDQMPRNNVSNKQELILKSTQKFPYLRSHFIVSLCLTSHEPIIWRPCSSRAHVALDVWFYPLLFLNILYQNR